MDCQHNYGVSPNKVCMCTTDTDQQGIRTTIDPEAAQGRELLLYFSDFRAAFTSVSHKAIDAALAAANASDKTRALIKVIYKMAELQVKVQGRDGDTATSAAKGWGTATTAMATTAG